MKRFICLILIALLFCGCSKRENEIEIPVNFYYAKTDISYNAADAVISAEVRDKAGYKDNWVGLLDLYLEGPLSDEFQSPFPANTIAMNAFREDSVLNIELSKAFSELNGLDLTLACACLTKTAAELTGCTTVKIYVAEAKLDGQSSITMNVDDLLLLDQVTQPAA